MRSKNIKYIQGYVVSDTVNKTRVIVTRTFKKHPLFKKSLRQTRRVQIHDEKNESRVGDFVRAIETRPLSRCKRHRLYRILERAT